MSSTALYTDLSRYYDLMCTGINYREQSDCVRRLHQLFGHGGKRYLDLACGTGQHVRHFMDFGYQASGLDIHQPMLNLAQQRCPAAHFFAADMAGFTVAEPFDLITCFLYSIHYNRGINELRECIATVHRALRSGGVFCFNAVDKTAIDNKGGVRHAMHHAGSQFVFRSSWHYAGHGDSQQLLVHIEKTSEGETEIWQDQHPMVAISFRDLLGLLKPFFAVHMFEHVYDRIEPWVEPSGNTIMVCVKK